MATNNELMNVNPAEIFAAMGTTSLAGFRDAAIERAERGEVNFLTRRSQKDGKTDTVMHIGSQITSDMIVGHALTIVRVGHASVPATDQQGNPIYVTGENGEIVADENGDPVQAISTFPVCWFREAKDCWYNGGKLLQDNIDSWADECGDDPNDFYLPKINAALKDIGGIQAYFEWKDKQDRSGQRYVNMILA